jgi:hypothetical protein
VTAILRVNECNGDFAPTNPAPLFHGRLIRVQTSRIELGSGQNCTV